MKQIYFSLILFLLGGYVVPVYSQVFQITERNFDKLVKDKDVMLIAFYMPWCKHCQALQPEWDTSEKVLEQNREFILGRVNCWEDGKTLCDKLDIQMYPDIRLYRHGKYIESYEGERNAAGILDFVQRAQATTGRVGSVPFWEKNNAQAANPPAGQVPLAAQPAPPPPAMPSAAAAPPNNGVPPVAAPPPSKGVPPAAGFASAPVPIPPSLPAMQAPRPPPPSVPNPVVNSPLAPRPAVPPPPLPPPVLPPPVLPPQPLPQQQVYQPPPTSHMLYPDTGHVPAAQAVPGGMVEMPGASPNPPQLPAVGLMEPGHATQWSTPVDQMNMAYNLAVSQDQPANFWNNVKFWHDFLNFINAGTPAYHSNLPAYPHGPVYPHDPTHPQTTPLHADYIQPQQLPQHYVPPGSPGVHNTMFGSEYQQYHPTPGYPVQYTSDLDSHNILRTETLQLPGMNNPLNEILGSNQYESSSVLQNPSHCGLRHNCPGIFSAKTPIFYLPPLNPLVGLVGPSAALNPYNGQRFNPVNDRRPVYIGVTRTLAQQRGKGPVPTTYIKPSVYKFLKRKKPLERFMKRPIIQGRYADPLMRQIDYRRRLQNFNAKAKQIAIRNRLPSLGNPISRTMTPLTVNTVNQIKALRAQYAMRHPQTNIGIPMAGNPLFRTMPVNPFLRMQGNPYAMSAILNNGAQALPNALFPWSIGSLQTRFSNRGYPVLPRPVRKPVYRPPPTILRKLPLLKKTTLPLPVRKKIPLPPRRAKLPPKPKAVVANKKAPTLVIAATKKSKKGGDLVGIWDKIYRFYTHKGAAVKIVKDAHEIAKLPAKSVDEETPKGIAVIEKFLQAKLTDTGKDDIGDIVDIVDAGNNLKRGSNKVKTGEPVLRLNNKVKTGVPVLRINPKKVQARLLSDMKFADEALKHSTEVQNNLQTKTLLSNASKTMKSYMTNEDSILKSISSTPHSWDKRGKVTFAISKKTNIPGRPRVTGVWGSLKRRKKRKSRKKRSYTNYNCRLLTMYTTYFSDYTDLHRPSCHYNVQENDYG